MLRVIISTLLLTGLLFPISSIAQDDAELSGLPGGRPELILRSGYMANVWVPAGLEPYEVDDYGRNLFYIELALNHPLFHLGEMFDVINVPSLRLETNFGYTSQSEGYYEVIPDVVRIVPYVRASTWVTVLESFSVRYRVERFDATLVNPTPGSDSTLYVTNEMRDIEIGYLSEVSNLDLTYELGYYYSEINWPEVYRISQWFVETPRVKDWGINMHGVYGALHFTGWPGKYGFHAQAVMRIGQVMGLDLRLHYEHPLMKDWSLGVEADGSYRYIAGFNHEYSDYIHLDDSNPYDTRFRVNVYTVFVLF